MLCEPRAVCCEPAGVPVRQKARVKKYLAETFGTFTLVFAGTGGIVIDQVSGGAVTHVGVGLTFGLVAWR